jgi:hypothetical protein
MSRFFLCGCVFTAGLAAGWLVRTDPSPTRLPDGSLGAGTRVVVVRPTGEFYTGANGSGERQEKTETMTLRIIKRQGEASVGSGRTKPWRITVGETTYILDEDPAD